MLLSDNDESDDADEGAGLSDAEDCKDAKQVALLKAKLALQDAAIFKYAKEGALLKIRLADRDAEMSNHSTRGAESEADETEMQNQACQNILDSPAPASLERKRIEEAVAAMALYAQKARERTQAAGSGG